MRKCFPFPSPILASTAAKVTFLYTVCAGLDNYKLIIVSMDVDDILIDRSSSTDVSKFTTQLCRIFQVKKLGLASVCLGQPITFDGKERVLKLVKPLYINSISVGLK